MNNSISCAYIISASALSTLIIIAEKAVWLYERGHGGVGWTMWGSLPAIIWILPIILCILAMLCNNKSSH